MARDWKVIDVDGQRYAIQRAGAVGIMELSGLVVRTVGAPLAHALATTESLPAMIASLAGATDGIEELLESDLASDRVLAFVKDKAPQLFDIVAQGIELFGEKATRAQIHELVSLAVLGMLKVDDGAGSLVIVESEQMFDDFMAPWIDEYGVAHLFRVIWACLRHHLGPTQGGSHGKRPPKSQGTRAAT